MSDIDFRTKYDNLKSVSNFALKTSHDHTHYRCIHDDETSIRMHIDFVIAIRNRWFDLRREMISKYGIEGLELTSVTEGNSPNTDLVDIMWQHWRVTKNCIEAVKGGLSENKL